MPGGQTYVVQGWQHGPMSTDDQFIDEMVPDGSEQLDQLEFDRSLIDRGVADPLDEGYIPPDDWSVAEGFGNTAAEMRQGETLDQRIKQEMPEQERRFEGEELDDHEVGRDDREAQLIGSDVGIDGAAASAEEAAMHIIDEDDSDSDED